MHELGVEVQIGVDGGILIDCQVSVLQGGVRALDHHLQRNRAHSDE